MAPELVADFDARVDAAFDRIRGNPVADRVFYTASALGEFGLIWVVFALLRALRGGRHNERAALRAIVATGVESFLVNVVMKSFVRRRRPVNEHEHPLPLRQPLSSSFPSGHATAAFCGATLLSDGDDPWRPVYYAAALVVATSRVYVRIHHASAGVGGMAVGRVLGLIGKRLAPLGRS
jgi:undecaprenyl-diphosphatase